MLSSSWSRPARRPARGGPHALCRLFDLLSVSPSFPLLCARSVPFPPFSPFSSWFSAPLGSPAHSHFHSPFSLSLRFALFPPFRRLPRPIANRFSFGSTIVRPRPARRTKRGPRGGGEKKKKNEKSGRTNKILHIIVHPSRYFLFGDFFLLCYKPLLKFSWAKESVHLCMFSFFFFFYFSTSKRSIK